MNSQILNKHILVPNLRIYQDIEWAINSTEYCSVFIAVSMSKLRDPTAYYPRCLEVGGSGGTESSRVQLSPTDGWFLSLL